MATRGSALSRAVRFFETADINEADYVLGRALSIVRDRKDAVGTPTLAAPKQRRGRRPKPTAEAPPPQQTSLTSN